MQFKVFDLGLVDFKEAWEFQKEIFDKVKNGFLRSGLILCQHYPVVTLGRQALKGNIRVSEYELKNMGIDVCEVERGGDVTYHGPGQIIAYPIFNLNWFKKDIHLFLRQLEQVVIDFLSDFGIRGLRHRGLTGVWVDPVRSKSPEVTAPPSAGTSNGVDKRKIASIGIAIRNWITFHGLSINIKKDDLENFRLIRPCGIDVEMTALENVLGRDIDISELKGNLIQKFKGVFLIQEPMQEVLDDQSSVARIR